jgi:selenocysteine lyase/cysteine desulfurase
MNNTSRYAPSAFAGNASLSDFQNPGLKELRMNSSRGNSLATINRRRFFAEAGLTAVTGVMARLALLPLVSTAHAAVTSEAGLTDWSAVRAQFNLASGKINMACLWQASHPKPVRDAIEQHRRGLDECPFEYFHANAARLETGVRTAAAEYLKARPDDFAMTGSTTQGLAIVYNGLKLLPGQEILSTEQDHIVTKRTLKYRAERAGTLVRTISLYERSDTVTEEQVIEAILRALTRRTRVVAVTWVHSATGVKIPIGRIAQALTRVNADRAEEDQVLLCVDGVHALGVEDFTAADLACDFFIAGCHKWLFGPRGTGLIWGRTRGWKNMNPTIASIDELWRHEPYKQEPLTAWMTPGGFHDFEHHWALAEAFRFHLRIGKAQVAARIHELNRQCKEGLAKLPHVRLQTPMSDNLSAGMVCFEIEGLTPMQAVERLKERGIVASTTPPYKYEYARVAPSLWNTPEEVDATLRAIRSLL